MDVSGLLLSASSLSFSVSLSLSWVPSVSMPFLRKPLPPPPPDFQYPMNSPHYYSHYRKYFLHFGNLFPFPIKSLNNFLFLIKPLSIPNSEGLVTSLL